MNVVIIEDEQPAYKRLAKLLNEVQPDINILAQLETVADAKQWLQDNDTPDVIFMDIHLADGSAFDLLAEVEIKAPVIFTTAYDQYAIEAFKTASVGYLLKPIKPEALKEAIGRIDEYKKIFLEKDDVLKTLVKKEGYKKRFLIRFGEHIKTVLTEEIAYCYSESKATFLKTFEGRTYPLDYNLDAMEQLLDPERFFRLNRQYIVCLQAISEMKTYSKARIIVTLNPEAKEQPVVSSEKSAVFKQWLAGDI